MRDPELLDLFSCAGGAATGYRQAGFRVTGVDINPQPNYPFTFVQADALDILRDEEFVARFDAIHASPTCQTYANVTNWRGRQIDHPDLLTPTLDLLADVRLPWVVENVPEAADDGPLRSDLLLCGTQFGLRVKRHRAFQLGNWAHFDLRPPHHCHRNPALLPFAHKGERAYADAMGCTWMNKTEARQAIPPAYTHYIGEALMAHLAAERAA